MNPGMLHSPLLFHILRQSAKFQTSNVLLLDLLQTERDFLESSQALLEAIRSSQIERYSYTKLTGELGTEFAIRVN